MKSKTFNQPFFKKTGIYAENINLTQCERLKIYFDKVRRKICCASKHNRLGHLYYSAQPKIQNDLDIANIIMSIKYFHRSIRDLQCQAYNIDPNEIKHDNFVNEYEALSYLNEKVEDVTELAPYLQVDKV